MTIQLREFKKTDADEVKALFLRSWRGLSERLEFDTSIVTPEDWPLTPTWVALIDNKLVGFVDLKRDLVDKLYVDPEAQHHGIGTLLLAQARRAGGEMLWVDEGNHRGRSFYEKNGWHWTGVQVPGVNYPDKLNLEYRCDDACE